MDLIIALIIGYSTVYNIDPSISIAIACQESMLDPKAVGAIGEVGLYQIRPEYYKIKKQKLFDPLTNIKLGLKHLAETRDRCIHQDNNSWIVCYNLGVAGGAKLKHPTKFKYYKEVISKYQRINWRKYGQTATLQNWKSVCEDISAAPRSKENYSGRTLHASK